MIAGKVISFYSNNEDPEVDCDALIELTDWNEDPFIELAADVGKRRVFFKLRMADLVRELDEAKKSQRRHSAGAVRRSAGMTRWAG